MADRKSDFALPTLDDLFSTQEERDDARLEKIRDIPLDLIDDFPDHPFHVRDDEDMVQLVESIKTNGVLTPAVLRQKEDGRYEVVSGHRRKRACELAGLSTLRSEIKDLTRDEAVVYMVESNFQRTTILPSEKAFAYKMRLEAMKRQVPMWKRSLLTVEEAALYSGIGRNKLRSLTDKDDCPFVLWIGRKRLTRIRTRTTAVTVTATKRCVPASAMLRCLFPETERENLSRSF